MSDKLYIIQLRTGQFVNLKSVALFDRYYDKNAGAHYWELVFATHNAVRPLILDDYNKYQMKQYMERYGGIRVYEGEPDYDKISQFVF